MSTKSMGADEKEGLVQTAELAHDWGLNTDSRMEELYRIITESRSNEAADRAFRCPAYEGTIAQTGAIPRRIEK